MWMLMTGVLWQVGCQSAEEQSAALGEAEDSGAEVGSSEDSGPGGDTGGGDTGGSAVPAQDACDPVEAAPERNPVQQLGRLTIDYDGVNERIGKNFVMDLLEVQVIAGEQQALGVGQGGLIVFTLDGDQPGFSHRVVPTVDGEKLERFHHVEYLGGGIAAVTSRTEGLFFLDINDLMGAPVAYTRTDEGLSGMALHGERLYVVSHGGALQTWSVEDPRQPALISTIDGLGSAWDIEVHGDVAYVADNLSVVPVDLSDPDRPQLLEPVDSGGSAQDLSVHGDTLYVADGAAGIAIFDLSDPTRPAPVGTADHGDSVVSVSADGELLWAVDHADVLVYDISEPRSPRPIGSSPTDEWALAVDAFGQRALVGDWGNLLLFDAAPDQPAPDARVSTDALYFYEGSGELDFELTNRGGAPLHISQLGISDPRFSATLPRDAIDVGETVTVGVRFEDDGAEAAAGLCLSTDDPDQPLLEVALNTSNDDSSIAVGQPAIDFMLPDVDGELYRLSDYLGKPVYLVYFATW